MLRFRPVVPGDTPARASHQRLFRLLKIDPDFYRFRVNRAQTTPSWAHWGPRGGSGWQPALADTSVFIGLEAARFDASQFAGFEWAVSVVTLGELRLGVLQARGPEAAARRLSTYQLAQRAESLPVDEAVSDAWALLTVALNSRGSRGGRQSGPEA